MTASTDRFDRRDSAIRAGVSIGVEEFISSRPADLIERLRAFTEHLSGSRRTNAHAEVASWGTTIPALQDLFSVTGFSGRWILLEAALPYGLGRIDCVLIGADSDGNDSVVVLELKAWSDARRPPNSNMLVPSLGGPRGTQRFVHPSQQAINYVHQLRDLLAVFHVTGSVRLAACSWLYNAASCSRAPFNDSVFNEIIREAPIYGRGEIDGLRAQLLSLASRGAAHHFLEKLDRSDVGPSFSLMRSFTDGLSRYRGPVLSDDQLEVFDRIVNAYDPSERRVIVVRGGPGAGKTVVALELLARFFSRGVRAVYFACSQAIVSSYKERFGTARNLFISSAMLGRTAADVQIIDEAHRLSGRRQVRAAIESGRLSVFLVDEHQVILPGDIKDTREITEAARSVTGRPPLVLDLLGDKRSGCEAYVRWVDGVLGIAGAPFILDRSLYSFCIVASPQEIEECLRLSGNDWRVVAGVCWERSKPSRSGELPNDVVLPEFNYCRPWSGDPKKLVETPFYKPSLCWATESAGRDLIGSVYTAQSFEFDYVGVIFGNDLVRRDGRWVPDLNHHAKGDLRFFSGGAYARTARSRDCLRHIYRVLLTRGRKGCFVYFLDPETRRHFESFLSTVGSAPTAE